MILRILNFLYKTDIKNFQANDREIDCQLIQMLRKDALVNCRKYTVYFLIQNIYKNLNNNSRQDHRSKFMHEGFCKTVFTI